MKNRISIANYTLRDLLVRALHVNKFACSCFCLKNQFLNYRISKIEVRVYAKKNPIIASVYFEVPNAFVKKRSIKVSRGYVIPAGDVLYVDTSSTNEYRFCPDVLMLVKSMDTLQLSMEEVFNLSEYAKFFNKSNKGCEQYKRVLDGGVLLTWSTY